MLDGKRVVCVCVPVSYLACAVPYECRSIGIRYWWGPMSHSSWFNPRSGVVLAERVSFRLPTPISDKLFDKCE